MLGGVEISDELLAEHHAHVARDNEFQLRARLHQALWREAKGLPIGEHRGRPLGSRLAMPFAQESLANYLTDGVRSLVRSEVKKTEKLYKTPRIYDDLLSSQPLCFNLFGELALDHELAGRAVGRLLGKEVKVTAVEFEHSPGRWNPRFTNDGSAFDVFVAYEASGAPGFLGVEVKYAEDLDGDEAAHRRRYDEVAEAMGVFDPAASSRLRRRPLEQFWRDHLLACSMLLDQDSGFHEGQFVVLYPAGNTVVADAVSAYRACLLDPATFTSWTFETMLDVLDAVGAGGWVSEVRERYL